MLVSTLVLIVVGLAVALGITMSVLNLRRREEVPESHVHEPDINTVEYVVPDGVDPSVVRAALNLSGFPSTFEDHWGVEHLFIECTPRDRERLRRLIAEVQHRDYVPELHLAGVHFRDES